MDDIWYGTIDGKWWLFGDGKPQRALTDAEAVQVIWGSGIAPLDNETDEGAYEHNNALPSANNSKSCSSNFPIW